MCLAPAMGFTVGGLSHFRFLILANDVVNDSQNENELANTVMEYKYKYTVSNFIKYNTPYLYSGIQIRICTPALEIAPAL